MTHRLQVLEQLVRDAVRRIEGLESENQRLLAENKILQEDLEKSKKLGHAAKAVVLFQQKILRRLERLRQRLGRT